MLPALVKLPRNSNAALEWSDDLLDVLKLHREATYKTTDVRSNQQLISATRGTANTPFYMLVACSLRGGYDFAISTVVPRKLIRALNGWIEMNGAIGDMHRSVEYEIVQTDRDSFGQTQFYNLNIRSKLPVAIQTTDALQTRFVNSLKLLGYLLPNVTPKLFKAILTSIEDVTPVTPVSPVSPAIRAELIDRLEYAIHLIQDSARTSPTPHQIRQIEANASAEPTADPVVEVLYLLS